MKVLLEISQNLQENTCTRVSGTGVFLQILLNFKQHLFLQNTSGGRFKRGLFRTLSDIYNGAILPFLL